MNTVSSDKIISPSGITDTVSKIVVDTLPAIFKFHNITTADKSYVLSFNAKTSSKKKVIVNGKEFEITSEWQHYTIPFTATGSDLAYHFLATGTYYFHNSQLETGNKESDYSPAPEDISVEKIFKDGTNKIDGTLIADDSIYSSAIAPLQILTKHLTADCVTADKIVSRAITADKIASHTITANEIAVGTIKADSAIIESLDASKITVGLMNTERLQIGLSGNIYPVYDTFEQVKIGSTYWYDGAHFNTELVRDSSTPVGHGKCAKITATKDDAYIYFGTSETDYGCIPVDINTATEPSIYKISAYVKASANNIPVQIYAVGHDEPESTNSSRPHTGNDFTVNTTWKRLEMNFRPSKRYVSLRFDNDGGAGTSIWITGIQVEKITSADQVASPFRNATVTKINGENIFTHSITADQINVNSIFAEDITATGSIKYINETTENNTKKKTELIIDKDNFSYGVYENSTVTSSSNSQVATLTDHLEIVSKVNGNTALSLTLDSLNGLQFTSGSVGGGEAWYKPSSAVFSKNGKTTTIDGMAVTTDTLTASIVKVGTGQIECTSQHMIIKPSPTESGYFFHLGIYEGVWTFTPVVDAQVSLGLANHRFSEVHSKGGVITTSDENEKDIIGRLDDRYINLLKELKPIVYRWKENPDGLRFGLGAQTTKALMDQNDVQGTLVQEHDGRFSMDYSQVIPLLIQAVQDIYSRI